MYSLVRLLFTIIIAVFTLILFNGKWPITLKQKLSFIAMCFVILVILAFVPLENAFIRFKSPEDANIYQSLENKKMNIIESESAAMFYEWNNYNLKMSGMFTKDEGGWKLPTSDSQYSTISGDLSVIIKRDKQNNEYLVFIRILPSYDEEKRIEINPFTEKLHIEDNMDSVFRLQEQDGDSLKDVYYAFIPNMDANYRLYVNGQDVTNELTLPS